MPRENKTQYALLGYLHYQSLSGYDLKKSIDSSIKFFWKENYGHIYPVLKRLEKNKYVTMEIEENPGKPAKKIYTITEKGREYFKQWLDRPPEPEKFRKEILLKIFFSAFYEDTRIIEYIQEEIRQQQELIETYKMVREHVETHNQINKNHHNRWMITIECGIETAKAQINWAQTALKMFEND